MARRLREPAAPYTDAPTSPATPRGAYGEAASARGGYGDEIPPGLLKPRNGAGRGALICGLIAFVCTIAFVLVLTVPLAIVLGLAAIVLGIMGRSRFRRGLATNPGSATAGIVLGVLSLLILGGLAVGGVALFQHNKQDFKDYGQCVQQAGTDSQKLQDCANQFKSQITQ